MLNNINALNALKAPVRQVEGRVYVYNADGSTAYTFRHDNYLKEFTVERIGDNSKFFGYGVSHKANIKVIDKDRTLTLSTANQIYPYFVNRSTGTPSSVFPYPYLDITEIHRDENTNELSITCYDPLYKAMEHKVSELTLTTPYTLKQFINACGELLGLSGVLLINISDTAFSLSYSEGANFEGTESIRDALNSAAEVTQTIYYIDKNNKLVFRKLDGDGDALLNIGKDDYYTLISRTNRKLTTLVSATELGDNLTASTGEIGTTQYIRDNPFWDLREDRATLLNSAINSVGNLTINQFECEWRGNYLLEIGDKISLTTKDNNEVFSYLLDDVTTYNGTLSEKTQWSYTDNDAETDATPVTLGDTIKQTYAKVDKVNKQIDLVVSDTNANTDAISSLRVNTESISLSVEETKKSMEDGFDNVNESVSTLSSQVSDFKIKSDEALLNFRTEIETNGIDKVTTETGFTFNNEGLTVSKTDSEMKTQITEDGMTVYKDDEAVLKANNVGVNAVNLHATTYLIIGTNSRFEDFGDNRTGCFWIGD